MVIRYAVLFELFDSGLHGVEDAAKFVSMMLCQVSMLIYGGITTDSGVGDGHISCPNSAVVPPILVLETAHVAAISARPGQLVQPRGRSFNHRLRAVMVVHAGLDQGTTPIGLDPPVMSAVFPVSLLMLWRLARLAVGSGNDAGDGSVREPEHGVVPVVERGDLACAVSSGEHDVQSIRHTNGHG